MRAGASSCQTGIRLLVPIPKNKEEYAVPPNNQRLMNAEPKSASRVSGTAGTSISMKAIVETDIGEDDDGIVVTAFALESPQFEVVGIGALEETPMQSADPTPSARNGRVR